VESTVLRKGMWNNLYDPLQTNSHTTTAMSSNNQHARHYGMSMRGNPMN